MILALDLGGTKLAAGLYRDNEIIAAERVSSAFAQWSDLVRWLDGYLERHGASRLDGLALATAGLVRDGRIHRLNRLVLPFVEGVKVSASLHDHYDVPVLMANDATAAAWGEYCHLIDAGALNQGDSLAYVTVSTGIGVGLVSNGRPVISANGLASHAGHTLGLPEPDAKAATCTCGISGCVESLASGAAIARSASRETGEDLTAEAVFARQHEENFLRYLILRSARQTAHLVDTLRMTLGVEHVVLGGGIGSRPDYQAEVHRQWVERPGLPDLQVHRTSHNALCGLVGVARLFTQKT